MALRMFNKVFPQAFVGSFFFSLITENSAKGTKLFLANMFFKFVKHTLLWNGRTLIYMARVLNKTRAIWEDKLIPKPIFLGSGK